MVASNSQAWRNDIDRGQLARWRHEASAVPPQYAGRDVERVLNELDLFAQHAPHDLEWSNADLEASLSRSGGLDSSERGAFLDRLHAITHHAYAAHRQRSSARPYNASSSWNVPVKRVAEASSWDTPPMKRAEESQGLRHSMPHALPPLSQPSRRAVELGLLRLHPKHPLRLSYATWSGEGSSEVEGDVNAD